MNYDHKKIESKWQKEWEKKKIFQAQNNSKKKKFYSLIEFPYPSGSGLHVGHIRSNTAMDIISRKRRMEGYNVLYPIGWDAFGLPTENYAIKTGKKPAVVTKKNTDIFRKQLKEIGFSFDWSREINTTDPEYYKWTQWIFLQLFKKGLAYKAKSYINWCLFCKITLANEEVVDGKCERCGGNTEKKEKEQWMLAITKYAERLDKDLDLVDYPERVKIQQRNWIGKSEGAEISFQFIADSFQKIDLNSKPKAKSQKLEAISIFTTRADTIFGVTYLVLAPEHSLMSKGIFDILENKEEVEKYIEDVKRKTDIERTSEAKNTSTAVQVKTGVELKGIKAINPANNEEVPVWVADYVLLEYGTGAVMAVPAHDERDFEFAKKYNLPIINKPLVDALEITKKVGGKMVTKFKLRDWIFSRQRYWGEPIPLVFCENCRDGSLASVGRKQGFRPENAGWIPLQEKDLPVKLPIVKNYKPTDTGESPLANISKWVNITCPICGGNAKRETDTMPNWAGSSWYYLRYIDSKNKKEFVGKKKLQYWSDFEKLKAKSYKPKAGPVDWYNGGMEHTTLHLLYSRFWHKFLYDLKLVPTVEPYQKRTSHGMILGEGGVKMSKSVGNVINPDSIVKTYGADTLRLYEMFIGPFDQAVTWSSESIIGPRRFLEKVWKIGEKIASSDAFAQVLGSPRYSDSVLGMARPDHSQKHAGSDSNQFLKNPLPLFLKKLLHKTIKKVSEDIENMNFNTAISSMMILVNEMEKSKEIDLEDFKKFLQILSPFAPHITEELYSQLSIKNYELKIKNKKNNSIHLSIWPKWDENLIKEEKIKIAIQINGKVRDEIVIDTEMKEEEIKEIVLQNAVVLKFLNGNIPKRVIYVKNRLINIVF